MTILFIQVFANVVPVWRQNNRSSPTFFSSPRPLSSCTWSGLFFNLGVFKPETRLTSLIIDNAYSFIQNVFVVEKSFSLRITQVFVVLHNAVARDFRKNNFHRGKIGYNGSSSFSLVCLLLVKALYFIFITY